MATNTPTRTAHKLASAAVLASALALLAGAGGGRIYRNEPMRIRAFSVPGVWESAPQASYPNALIAYSHPDGARLVLTGEHAPKKTASEVVAGARPVLERQGYRNLKVSQELDRFRLEAAHASNGRTLHQAYICASGYCYVVTLVSPPLAANSTSAIAQTTRDFDDAVRSMVLLSPTHVESSSDGGAPGAGARDGGHGNLAP